MTIEMAVKDLAIEYDLTKRVVQDNVKSIKLHFNFDSTWDDLPSKVVTFYAVPDGKDTGTSYSVECENDSVAVPSTILTETGKLYVSVWGTNSSADTVAQTEKMVVPLKIKAKGQDPGEIMPEEEMSDLFTKLYKLYSDLQELKPQLEELANITTVTTDEISGLYK